jgi:hypothetical protein
MSDGWTDRKGTSLLNFLVHFPRGTMFIKSIDASTHVKDVALFCELMYAFIQEINMHNVVQIITYNARITWLLVAFLWRGVIHCFGLHVLHIVLI